MTSDIILLLVVMGMGILIGRNWHGETQREYKKRLLRELDSELKDELIVANNLNESLKEDIAELKRKLRKLELERK
jgi:polyhydroxyalkanoate synthesis regulator phasin